jgi:hypothetical protein
VFPEGVEGSLIYDYGYCGTPLVDTTLYSACMAQLLTFEDIMMTSFPKHLDVPFGYIQVSQCKQGDVMKYSEDIYMLSVMMMVYLFVCVHVV